MGAAVQGHILAAGDARTGGADLAGTTDLLLLDVTPLSLGIELEGREMSVLIKRNTTIPCRKSRSYTTVEDWQTSIDVVVYEVRKRIEKNSLSRATCPLFCRFMSGRCQRDVLVPFRRCLRPVPSFLMDTHFN